MDIHSIQMTRNDKRRTIDFTVESTDELDWFKAAEIQTQKGYHPTGYGLYALKSEKIREGSFRSTWRCSQLCD